MAGLVLGSHEGQNQSGEKKMRARTDESSILGPGSSLPAHKNS